MLLYTYPENYRAYRALIAAQYSGANLKVAPGFTLGETNKSEAFLKKFPLGKVSVIIKQDQAWNSLSQLFPNFVLQLKIPL